MHTTPGAGQGGPPSGKGGGGAGHGNAFHQGQVGEGTVAAGGTGVPGNAISGQGGFAGQTGGAKPAGGVRGGRFNQDQGNLGQAVTPPVPVASTPPPASSQAPVPVPTPTSSTPPVAPTPTTQTHPGSLGTTGANATGLFSSPRSLPSQITAPLASTLTFTLPGSPSATTPIGSVFGAPSGGSATAGTTAAHSTAGSTASHPATQLTVPRVATQSSSAPTVIQRIERVVPGFVWGILAGALALAVAGGLAVVVAGRRVRRNAGQFAAVTAAAMTDPLTGILNRRGFLQALERELARARRYNRPFVLAYVDVRGLKKVNDTEGHLAGDELLRQAANLLKESARADDVVGRIGGDEMGLLLVEQGPHGADAVINRIVSEVPSCRAELGLKVPWDLTVGTAAFPEDGSTVTELLATADRRLYEQRGIALR